MFSVTHPPSRILVSELPLQTPQQVASESELQLADLFDAAADARMTAKMVMSLLAELDLVRQAHAEP